MRLHSTHHTPQILGESKYHEEHESDPQVESEIRLFQLLRNRVHHPRFLQLQLLQWLLLLLQLLQQCEELFQDHRTHEVLLSGVLQSE